MKRIFAAVLALCLCAAGAAMAQESEDGWAAGDTVVFGSYEQDNVLTNGKEPLEWIVLKTEGDRAMLITRYLIDARAYHKAFVKMTWSECTLRQWLNDTFLKETFSQEEQARIQRGGSARIFPSAGAAHLPGDRIRQGAGRVCG